jgi:hypothetical protein
MKHNILFFVLLLPFANTFAQDFSDYTVYVRTVITSDTSVVVPVSISKINPEDSVQSFQFDLMLPDGLEYVGYHAEGTHSSGTFVATNVSDTLLTLASASSVNLEGTKPLIELSFNVEPARDYPFRFENLFLNNQQISDTRIGRISVIRQLGDIDNDGTIFAYDAAKVLQYSVGLEPLPVIDPLPWDIWRFKTADVDNNNLIQAADATSILEYSVGLIYSFEGLQQKSMTSDVQIKMDDQAIIFHTDNPGLRSFNVSLPVNDRVKYGEPFISSNSLSAINEDSKVLRIGISSLESLEGSFLKIPIELFDAEYLDVSYIGNVTPSSKRLYKNTIENEDTGLPAQFSLLQNYPNPFNPSTQIQYVLPEASLVTLEVLNSVGQKVTELVNTQKPAGHHTATFDASGLSSGVYLYKLTTPSFTQTKKMLLVK